MNQYIHVLGVKLAPILQLVVSRPPAADRAVSVPGQSEVDAFHITLARLDDLGVKLGHWPVLTPPLTVGLQDEIRLVDTGGKQSCYVEVDAPGQAALKAYVQAFETAFEVSILDEARVFHVTLSNAGLGEVRASVGNVWEHPSKVV